MKQCRIHIKRLYITQILLKESSIDMLSKCQKSPLQNSLSWPQTFMHLAKPIIYSAQSLTLAKIVLETEAGQVDKLDIQNSTLLKPLKKPGLLAQQSAFIYLPLPRLLSSPHSVAHGIHIRHSCHTAKRCVNAHSQSPWRKKKKKKNKNKDQQQGGSLSWWNSQGACVI